MIFSDSRYSDGELLKSLDARKGLINVSVTRTFPSSQVPFFYYTWNSSDRIDLVALSLLGDPELWWEIMDLNPEIINPMGILPGTIIRIPSV